MAATVPPSEKVKTFPAAPGAHPARGPATGSSPRRTRATTARRTRRKGVAAAPRETKAKVAGRTEKGE